ncbi:hypothetical protein, partial [Bacillus thuringiensis]
TGATGATGPTPGIIAEIQGVGTQLIEPDTDENINFTLNTKVGDGSVLVNGINIILPETGSYVVCYTVSGDIGSGDMDASTNWAALLRQLNTGGTFDQTVIGSRVAIVTSGTGITQNADGSISNCAVVCVSDTGGGNLNNIIRLNIEAQNSIGPSVGISVQRDQTSVTVTKVSDEVCGPY